MNARPLEQQIDHYVHWNSGEDGAYAFPPGRIDRIYTHWSANDYEAVFPAYHYCVATAPSGIIVVQTNDARANMRDVRKDPQEPYAAHTRGRNSYAVGISIMAMQGASPHDFGAYPVTPPLVDALCLLAARLAKHYNVPVDADHIMSHAEAALIDGYFGTGEDQRWDIARLQADPAPLEPREAITTGDELRRRILARV